LFSLLGGVLYINNSTRVFNPYTSLYVKANALTNIEVKRTFIRKLGPPYGNCIPDLTKSDSYLYKYIIDNKMKYSQQLCYNFLHQKVIEAEIGCSFSHFPKINKSLDYCGDMNLILALANIKNSINILNSDEILCPLECESIQYTYTISDASPLTSKYLDDIRQNVNIKNIIPLNISNEDLANSIVLVNVYYNEMGYTEILELPNYTFISLVSNLGGQLGLFLGMSFLSFFELVEVFMRSILLLWKKWKNSHIIKIESNSNIILQL
jgi:hypothetical protein